MDPNRNAATNDEAGLLPSEAVEVELVLDLAEPSVGTFGTCVRDAMQVIGGEVLFDMPSDGSLADASRIAAVRVPGSARDRIVFAILNETATSIRVAERDEVGDRFYGLAHAFVGVLTHLRDAGDLAKPS